ncbi:unnamed protein product [Phytophthora lilii]|uniref:Unnamed protein product n=1 Tax=Phytophthora lilii TaxID=2077276 RepID=A0A9W6TIN1_9STRA|nr:unnamed protein product [Phytophthora lilii]
MRLQSRRQVFSEVTWQSTSKATMDPRVVTSLLLFALRLATTTAASVHLFGDTNFGRRTGHWLFEFSLAQFCINTPIFDNKASSAQWRDLPQTGNFANNEAFIAFYTERKCTGTIRTWPTAEKNFPTTSHSTISTTRFPRLWSGKR